MKRLSLVALIAFFSISILSAGNTHATLITLDFNDIGGGAWSGDRYIDDGVSFSTDGAGLFSFDASYTNTPPTYIYGSTSSSGGGANANIIVDFLGLTDYVEFFLADVETGTGSAWFAQIFDSAMGSLGSVTGNTNDESLVSFSVAGISRLIFSPSSDSEGIDTLSFNSPAPVPEPSTILLLGGGLAGLAFYRRKAKK